jgi:hypothetical protein
MPDGSTGNMRPDGDLTSHHDCAAFDVASRVLMVPS